MIQLVQDLKCPFLKGIMKKPESYVPRDLFNKFHINPYKFSSGGNFNPLHGDITDWLKVLAVRNPWNRLYSAWKDKTRTFRFPNGTVNWDKAFRNTFLIGSVVIQSKIVTMILHPMKNTEKGKQHGHGVPKRNQNMKFKNCWKLD